MHQLLYNQSFKEVDLDIKKSIEVIENITGKKVVSFRAPGFSITEKNKWVFECLYNNGITHDSSIFPSKRAHGGMPGFKNAVPSKLKINGINLRIQKLFSELMYKKL